MSETKKCSKCAKDIAGPYMTSESSFFHTDCFICDECQSPLTGPFSKRPDGGRVCEACKPKETCSFCSKQIAGEQIKAAGQSFHPDCFKCSKCSKGLEGKFFIVGEKLHCDVCAKASQQGGSTATAPQGDTPDSSKVCKACGKVITGGAVKADEGQRYHLECFKCGKCKQSITDSYFRDDNGVLVCGPCNTNVTGGGQRPPTKTTVKSICVACKQAIEGDLVLGDHDDPFHDKCFICADCGRKLESFTKDQNRQFKFQKARYLCTDCGATPANMEPAPEEAVSIGVKPGYDPGSFGGGHSGPTNSSPKPCCMCGSTDVKEDEGCTLADGKVIHWRCFKCCKCGSGKKPDDMKLFRSKVERVLKGTYECDVCATSTSKASGGPALRLERAQFNMNLGPYFGQGRRADGGGEVKFMVRLLQGRPGRCRIEQAPVGDADLALTWCVEGDYTENPNDDGVKGSKSICFVVESVVSGAFSDGAGHSMELFVVAGESHPGLVCCGVKCSLQIGTPEHELSTMMRTLQVMKKEEAPATVELVWADTSTSFPLAQVQNEFKALNIDPSKREMYLADAEFQTLFGVSKEAFAGQPKWKRDAKKKELKLF